ncbi:dynamin-1 [Setomelanomma holmii]|uniref:Dynamin-1 n=1 Tax=Setomelanomma holmii TaxID=210430 RepID=A0A9P4LUQ3_9PLEO|nr:dynamin-1 [Setomelanomma holmii]
MSPTTPSSPVFFEATSRAPTIAMGHQQAEQTTLGQLQTLEQIKLLDSIDELRSQGLGHHGISLPQLIVCGDQSTGKSSLLEGLTRLRFPTKGVLCTTFATEVVLRREDRVDILCTIIPGKGRSHADRRELKDFQQTFPSSTNFDFSSLVEKAKIAMAHGGKDDSNSIHEDVLRVRYSGPDLPSLTIVDLPGFILQSLDGGDSASRIQDLVTSYMCNEKSIILAVVQAGSEPECQQVFTQLMAYDKEYSRTLGIITKPDTIERGSEEEHKLIQLAKNGGFPLRHRWHSVRNRGSLAKDQPDSVRDDTERQFFATGAWATVARQDVGIESLRTKLSRVLLEHVGKEVPSIIAAVQCAIEATTADLKALGEVRETSKDQRAYLTCHAQEFHSLTHDALRGIYTNPLFALSSPDEQSSARLRTAVQNLNIAFAHVIAVHSNERYGTSMEGSHPAAQTYDACFEEPERIDRAVFLEGHIGGYVRQSRQSGLPSLVNPLVIGEVFRQQSRNWGMIAKHHLRQVFQAIKDYVKEALESLMDERTRNLLMFKQIQPDLEKRWNTVEEKLKELLIPYTEQDPITYDPGFLRNLEGMRALRHRQKFGANPSTSRQQSPFAQSGPSKASSESDQRLLTESMDDFTTSEILDLVLTYYSSAISVFISNVAVLAVENCLLKNLSGIFCPTLTANMDDEQLCDIAAESEESRRQRLNLREKLQILEAGKQVLYEQVAKTPVTSSKKASQYPLERSKENRPRTPTHQASPPAFNRPGRQDTMADLASKLNKLAVTPPPSGSNAHDSSRRRVDSAMTTPSKAEMRSHRRQASLYDQIRNAGPEYDSDEV